MLGLEVMMMNVNGKVTNVNVFRLGEKLSLECNKPRVENTLSKLIS